MARPTKMSSDTLKKLEDAFWHGTSDREACFKAGVTVSTLYNYQHRHPEFLERKRALKSNPVFLAMQSVIDAIQSDPNLALKYLERKCKRKFSLRQENINAETSLSDIERMSDEEIDAEIKKLIKDNQ